MHGLSSGGEKDCLGCASAALVVAGALVSPPVLAQWAVHPDAKVPRTADGQVNLKAPAPRASDGRPDLFGVWETVRAGSTQVIAGPEVHPLKRTSQFWNIGTGLDGDLPLQPWAAELRASRVAANSKDNPDV